MKHLISALVVLLSAAAQSQIQLTPLQENEITYGCGCSFHLHNRPAEVSNIILMWEVGEAAKMRISGKSVSLHVSESKSDTKPGVREKVGDRTVYELKATHWSVKVDCRATKVCAGDSTSCESTSYVGQVLVTSPSTRKVFEVHGTCGC
jgi:hypothetical protein